MGLVNMLSCIFDCPTLVERQVCPFAFWSFSLLITCSSHRQLMSMPVWLAHLRGYHSDGPGPSRPLPRPDLSHVGTRS